MNPAGPPMSQKPSRRDFLHRTIALGASAAGVARPALQALTSGGRQAAGDLFEAIERELRAVMLLTGCSHLAALKKAPRVLGSELRAWIEQA